MTVYQVLVRQSNNQRRHFCAVLLGPPEEIALCALSTHYSLAAASFNPGICTSLPLDAYSLTELLLHRIVFLCHTHSTHGCSALIDCACKHTRQCNFQVQVDPAIYHSQRYGICLVVLGRTDSYYSLLSHIPRLPSLHFSNHHELHRAIFTHIGFVLGCY